MGQFVTVQQNGMVLRFVRFIMLINELSVRQNGMTLTCISFGNRTYEICKFAVQQNGMALEYILNQTEEICKLAILQNSAALKYVKIKIK